LVCCGGPGWLEIPAKKQSTLKELPSCMSSMLFHTLGPPEKSYQIKTPNSPVTLPQNSARPLELSRTPVACTILRQMVRENASINLWNNTVGLSMPITKIPEQNGYHSCDMLEICGHLASQRRPLMNLFLAIPQLFINLIGSP